jgi:predicted anti-sigma-YlaC factor YlaD
MKLPLMTSCRKAAVLTEKKLAGELGWAESFQLFLHRAMCDGCRRYGQQIQSLDQLLRRESQIIRLTGETYNPPVDDSEALENKILDNLKNL